MIRKYLLALALSSIASAQNFDAAANALISQSSVSVLDATVVRNRYVNWPKAATPYMTCNTPNLVIVDTTAHKYTVSCSLTVQPKVTVTVFLEAFGLRFSVCFMQFTTSNWQTPQSFDVLPSLDLFATQKAQSNSIFMLAFAQSESYNNQTFTIPVTQTCRQPVTCDVSGDPHVTGFDQDAAQRAIHAIKDVSVISYQGKEDYIVVESALALRIIGRNIRCGRDVTCGGGYHIQYQRAMYMISFTANVDVTINTLTHSNVGNQCFGTDFRYGDDKVCS